MIAGPVAHPVAGTRHPDPTPRGRLDAGTAALTRWSLRLLAIGAAVVVLGWALAQVWTFVLPALLAVLLSTLLVPVARALRRVMPAAPAALLAVVGLLATIVGLGALLAPSVQSQAVDLLSEVDLSVDAARQWLEERDLARHVGIDDALDRGIEQLQANGASIADAVVGGALTGVVGLGSMILTALLTLVLTFFFCKDGDRFLPWVRHWLGRRAAPHVETVARRVWSTLGSYLWTQAAVALVDAVFIGLGLWLLDVPFAMALAVLIFFAGFIPIVGAVTTGLLATLVALLSGGPWTALAVLGIVVLVQQLESNVLQPALVGRALALHPLVVLGSVTIGGTLAGVTGAFLAVPVAAAVVVTTRYVREVLVGDEG